ncbi:MAG: hypothetical protein NTZ85_02295 [Bacteroidia bacterium]|nr:hypothetical protein [Bacteroidia bacterium]
MNTKNRMEYFFYVFMITIIAVGCNNRNKKKAEIVSAVESIFFVPFRDIRIENTTYQVGAGNDTILSYKTGSKIIIPENAFLDNEGKPVKGNVELTYREFTNAFDVYLGGIPMVYDSAGIEQVFETAGMIEINASSDGQHVFPNPQNKIQVQMNSFQKGNEYNVYRLDTVTGKWNFLGKDKVETADYKKIIASLPQIPPMPKKAGQFAFKVSDLTSRYPELNIYKNVLFEPVDNKYHGFSGTEIKVKDSGKGIFNVIFVFDAYGAHKEDSCNCYLSFKEGIDYDNAIKVYQSKYKTLFAKRDKMKKDVELKWENYFDVKQKYVDLGLIDLFNKTEVTNLTGEEKITRTLEISGFGFINCDSPTAYPQGAELLPKYKDTKGNEIILNNVVLVEKGRNAIFRYKTKIKFNPQKENILWGITRDNKLAYLKAADFEKVTRISGEYTFTINVYPETLKTYEDICRVLF